MVPFQASGTSNSREFYELKFTEGKEKLSLSNLKCPLLKCFKKASLISISFLRASLCKILISSFAHKMDFAHNFSVDFV